MGNITHTVTQSYVAPSGSVTSQTKLTFSGESNVITILSPGTSNQVETVQFTISQLEGLAITCTGDFTVIPYNSSTAGTTIGPLTAGSAVIWTLASGVSCPIAGSGLSGQVTSIKVSSTSGGQFTFLASVNTGS